MIQLVCKLLSEAFGKGKEVNFESLLTKDASLAHLNALIYWKPNTEEIYGNASESEVRLQMVHYYRHNGTVYIGRLVEIDGKVHLLGKFTTSAFSRITSAIFLACVLFISLGGLSSLLVKIFSSGFKFPDFTYSIAHLIPFFVVFALFAAVAVWQATPTAKDVRVISEAIRRVL